MTSALGNMDLLQVRWKEPSSHCSDIPEDKQLTDFEVNRLGGVIVKSFMSHYFGALRESAKQTQVLWMSSACLKC